MARTSDRLAALLFLAACNASGVIVPDDTGDPALDDTATDDTGPGDPDTFLVGTVEDEAHGTDGVVLPVQVWFPATSVGGIHAYDGLYPGEAHDDAAGACDTPRPVVVFSHGNTAIRYQSYFLTEDLARHGYLVVAPDHVGNTAIDNGTVPFGTVLVRRPVDVADAFDWLADRSERPDSPWHGCVDREAGYAVVGHSLGGYTALAVAGAHLDLDGLRAFCFGAPAYFLCPAPAAWDQGHPGDDSGDLSDPRAWAAVPLAPAGVWGFQEGLADVDVPTLVVGGTSDLVTPWGTEVEPIYDRLEAEPRALAGLQDAGHFAFTDFCHAGWDGCNAWNMPIEAVHRWARDLTLEHLEATRAGTPMVPPAAPGEVVWEAPSP